MKRRPKKAPEACWVSWCKACGKLGVADNSQRVTKRSLESHGCSIKKEDIDTELYVLDRIAMKLLDAKRAEIAALQVALDGRRP